MTPYSQTNLAWTSNLLGNGSVQDKTATTLGKSGCAVTCIAILSDTRPDQVNWTLQANHGFNVTNVIWSVAAKLFNLDYNSDTTRPLKYPCIAETQLPKSTHFFVLLNQAGDIIDPLDGEYKHNPYKIISYRNLTPKKETTMANMYDDPVAWEEVINAIREFRLLVLGHIDEVGANADALRVKNAHSGGELKSVMIDIWNSDEAKAYRGQAQVKLDQIKAIIG